MAVSGSTNFKETAQQLIIDALSELGVADDEEPLEAVDLNKGIRAMNRMLKAWQADGVMVWTLTEGTFPLVVGQQAYTFGPGGAFTGVPFEITDMRINRSGNDLPMYRLSREEYQAMPSKTNRGYPTQFYYDRQRSGGTMYLWPAPDTATGTVKFTYSRVIMDIDVGANDIDLPQEWHEAIVYGLAARLVGPYSQAGKPSAARVEALAQASYQTVKGFGLGEGQASVRVTPSNDYRAY